MNQWSNTLIENSDRTQSILREFLENRQSCGEIIRYRIAPHLRQIISEKLKREEELKRLASAKKETKKDKKESSSAKAKSPTREKSPNRKQPDTIQEDAVLEQEIAETNTEEPDTTIDSNPTRIKLENSNMVCFGLPDIYMIN